MHRNISRAEFVDRLLTDIRSLHEVDDSVRVELLEGFSKAILRRADNRYLYRHRLTTLGAQLVDSLRWVTSHAAASDVSVRVFRPTEKEYGYELEGRVIETLMPDQPFIFDTLKLFMQRFDVRVYNSLNVIFPIVIGDGGVTAINAQSPDARNYSYTRWYVDWPGDMPCEDVERRIRNRLGVSRDMVRDFHRMVRAMKDLSNDFEYLAKVDAQHREDCTEVRDFLQWLVDDNFVFMGISFYERQDDGSVVVDVDRGLGSTRNDERPSGQSTGRSLDFFGDLSTIEWPIAKVRKSGEETLVHRAGKIDEILVRTFDDQCRPSGGLVVHGMFTFKGLGQSGSDIPVLRRKVGRIIEEQMPVYGSYEHKSLLNAFNSLPVEFLFEAPEDVITGLLQISLKGDQSGEIQSRVVINEDSSSAYAFVVLPKEHYSDELRQHLQRMLARELQANYSDHRVHLGKFGSVALHFYLTTDTAIDPGRVPAAERKLIELGTPWTLQLRQQLDKEFGETEGARLYARYRDAFSDGYVEMATASEAVEDIRHLDRIARKGGVRFQLFESRAHEHEALLRIYSAGEMLLTDILPVVDNFGIVVIEQYAFDIHPRNAGTLTVNTLRIERGPHDAFEQRKNLIKALKAVFGQRMRSDRINRLMLVGHLTWKEVDLVRAYHEYSRQLGMQLGAEPLQRVLSGHPDYVGKLAALFRTRFDPAIACTTDERAERVAVLAAELREYLDGVKSFDEDRVLRTFLNLVEATIRTNFYREREDGEHLLALKIESGRVTEMPDPRPMYEIFVHHARMEGVHLRGGKVARGGLRWSDRRDDFRSEILGLMATQMLKNTLIVPVGAKGGFVLTNRIDDYAAARKEADEVYRLFIRGLLEVTDNIKDGEVVAPPDVVRYDGDDPYLVVAADKGTAHLSDTANAVAASFDFWLGDAFASGGSVGYDHKEKGITAKSAWVCVRRHFAEMGIDPEKDPITVVGIGDMSGDVFGNGMLLSTTMKLIAAFNHRHIFVDPDPDPAASFAERQRLFDLGRSQWTDYDRKVMSKGGGIYDRGAKAIDVTPEAAAAIGCRAERMSGEDLIRAILKADVDLLWNGGIGTYVKASTETHHDVEDKDNDRVRVNADELRCRVLAEGGNLGVTMRGRVEYAHQRGRINLDAIDNSGGVDLSDHEVNLKTLLAPQVRSGALAPTDRDKLLVEVGDQVCDMVLEDSYSQAMALSLDELRSKDDVWAFSRAIDYLRAQVGFSRRVERLPRGTEVFEHRAARRQGMLRPELAKLLAFTKMDVYRALTTKPIGDRAALLPYLEEYFPPRVVAEHEGAIAEHMLFAEIAATVQTNRMVDNAGITFVPRMVAATERSVTEIAAAYFLVEQLLQLRPLRKSLKNLRRKVKTEAKYAALLRVDNALGDAVLSVLSLRHDHASLAWKDELASVSSVIEAIGGDDRAISHATAGEYDRDVSELKAAGIPEKLARPVALLELTKHAFRIAAVAEELGMDAGLVARVYFSVGHGVGIIPLITTISRQVYRDGWDHLAVMSIQRVLQDSMQELTAFLARSAVSTDISQPTPVEETIASLGNLVEIGEEIRNVLQERVPVSATFVLAERLRHRIRAAAEASGYRKGPRAVSAVPPPDADEETPTPAAAGA